MRSFKHHLVALVLVALPFALGGCMEQDATLTIKPDGTCVMKGEMTIARAIVEKQIAQMRRFIEEPEEGEEKKEEKPLTDEELAKAVRETFENGPPRGGEAKLDAVEVKKDKVRIVVTVTYPTVKEMVTHMDATSAGFMFRRTVVDKDDKGHLRLTFSTPKRERRELNQALAMLRATGFKGTFRFVLPGKILQSSLPNTKGNTSWFTVDAKKKQSVDAMRKLCESAIVITSEMGGLKLDELPLDSEKLMARRWRRLEPEPQLPVTDAGPGFAAEATSITTTTYCLFPEGEKLMKEPELPSWGDEPGLVVRGKLFCPRGRHILSLEQARATKALDDKGRAIKPEEERPGYVGPVGIPGRDAKPTSASIELRLQLPEPDAEAIEQLYAEAIVTTYGKLKTHAVAELKADPKKEIDLSDILADTKMVITKVKHKKREKRADERPLEGDIGLKITGPPEIRHLDFKVELPGAEHIDSHKTRDRSQSEKKRATRTLTLSYYIHRPEGKPDLGRMTLKATYPDELRRERVKFTLQGLDLF